MTSAHQVVSVFIDFLLHVGLADITTRDSVYQEDISVYHVITPRLYFSSNKNSSVGYCPTYNSMNTKISHFSHRRALPLFFIRISKKESINSYNCLK